MTRRNIILPILLLFATLLTAQQTLTAPDGDGNEHVRAKAFFNLTADDVKIDSVLPHFAYSIPVGEQYADSVYTAELLYPEFIDMQAADVARYQRLADGEPGEMPALDTFVAVDRKQGRLVVSFVPIVVRDGKWQKLVSFMVSVKSSANASAKGGPKSVRRAGAAARYAEHSVLASGNWAKIRVPESGIYQLTESLVKQAGFSDVSKVKVYGYGGALQSEALSPEEIISTDDLKEVPLCVVNGKRLFHAVGPVTWGSPTAKERTRNPYSDYGYYFLTSDGTEPLTVDNTKFLSDNYPLGEHYHVLHEKDNYSWYHGGRRLYEDNPFETGQSRSFTLTTPGHTTSGHLTVAVSAESPDRSMRETRVSVALNGTTVGTVTVVANDVNHISKSLGHYLDVASDEVGIFAVDNLQAVNTITLTGVSGETARPDYIAITYDTPAAKPDLTTTFPSPEYVYNITNQDLHADSAYQMVIIIPTSQKLRAQAERLRNFHEEHDSLRVKLVPADELFNEFSSGTPDANAYRRYLKMLYDRADSDDAMPRYLLLFGDCSWDNRMLQKSWKAFSPDDFLLCWQSENSYSEADCVVDDNFFCYLDDYEGANARTRDMPDVAVGRFPVKTAEEAKIVVDKTIAYIKNENVGDWQNIAVFMGDDGNDRTDQNTHMVDANNVGNLLQSLNRGMYVKRVMWDAYDMKTTGTGNSYPGVETLLKQQIQQGALLFDYTGHGRGEMLSHEKVLTLSDFKGFTNNNLGLWITAACDVSAFDGLIENIGEAALLNAKGGAIAFFGTARTVYTSPNLRMNRQFINALFTPVNGKYVSIGEAQRIAKNKLVSGYSDVDLSNNKLAYQLLGDPALVLHIPPLKIVIDSINGVADLYNTIVTLKAGSLATVAGHVEGNDEVVTDFDGTVWLMVRDTEETIVCKLNNPRGAVTPFRFTDRQNVMFSGSEAVKQGRFRISFPVPLDINYSGNTGMINAFARADDRRLANGYNSTFLVGGSVETANDSIGPSIYCYLNTPDFVNGGKVNSSPYFVAVVKDKDGLNTSGVGIGHDLELVIDNNPAMTYVLNGNFSFDFGSYTSGSTFYSIPTLDEGTHSLRFRAWDALNNPSTAELQFQVVRGMQPHIMNIGVSQNPARTNTTFMVAHDRSGSTADVEIEVFDVSGRQLWKHTDTVWSTDATYTYDWNLSNDGGVPLQTGVYLYRARITCDGSSYTSKAQRLVIVR